MCVDFWGRVSYNVYEGGDSFLPILASQAKFNAVHGCCTIGNPGGDCMKLSTAILANKLKSKFALQNKKALSDKLHLEQVLFYSDGDEMQPHKIYIYTQKLESAQELIVPEEAVLFCFGKVRTRNTGKNGQVFQLIDETSPFLLLNEIQRLFDYYEHWEKKIYELVNQGSSIQELLDESFRMFHNPIIVSSADYFVIGYSSIIDTKEELSSLVDLDSVFKSSDEYQNGKRILNQRKKKGAYYLPEYITGARTLRVNIFENDRYAYQVMMVESLSRFESYDGALLEHLTEYIKMALSKQMNLQVDMGYHLDRILSDILSNPGQDRKTVEQRFSEFGWMPAHRYFCINLKVNSLDWETMTVRFICKHMEGMLGEANSCAFQYENNIAIFVNLTLLESSMEEVLEKIVSFLKDTFLKAGISNEFTGFESICFYYRQAAIALEVGNRRTPYQWMYHFQDMALDYLLEQGKGELPAELVCSRKVLDLKKFDEEHNTDYYHTLKLYVKTHLNAVQTAKQLYIHRSTFLYRMEKIGEIVNLDLEDYDTLLYIMMTLRMMEMEGVE